MRLRQALLFVVDVEVVQRFYVDVLGCAVLDAAEGFVRLDAGGCTLALHAVPADVAAQIDPAFPRREDVPTKLCFTPGDGTPAAVTAERGRLLALGVDVGEVRTWGDLAFCDLADPEGNVVQLTTG